MATNAEEWFAIARMQALNIADPSRTTSELQNVHDIFYDEDTYNDKTNTYTGYFFSVRFECCALKDSKIENCTFVNVTFIGCDFNQVIWDSVYLKDMIFVNCVFDDDLWRNDHMEAKTLTNKKFWKHTLIGDYVDVPPELSDGTSQVEKDLALARQIHAEKILEDRLANAKMSAWPASKDTGTDTDDDDDNDNDNHDDETSVPIKLDKFGFPVIDHPYFPSIDRTTTNVETVDTTHIYELAVQLQAKKDKVPRSFGFNGVEQEVTERTEPDQSTKKGAQAVNGFSRAAAKGRTTSDSQEQDKGQPCVPTTHAVNAESREPAEVVYCGRRNAALPFNKL